MASVGYQQTNAVAQPGGQAAQPANVVAQQGVEVTSSAKQVEPAVSHVIKPVEVQSPRRAIGGEGLSSLNKIISSMRTQMPRAAQVSLEEGQGYIDPQSESKLNSHKQQLIDAVLKSHPRFNAAFHKVTFEGNVITVEAPTIALESDLNDSRTEICDIIAGVAGVEGQLVLKVVLNEVEVKLMPVKIEDRYQFIEDINPKGVKFFIEKFDLTL